MSEQVFTGFHHFAIRTPDLQRSVSFYEELGFRQVHDWLCRTTALIVQS